MTGTMPTGTDLQRTVEALRRELEARTAELAEARAERAATAEILEVINSSPADLVPVFEAILRNAHALCGVAHGSLQILEDGHIRAVALHGIAEALADRLRRPRAAAEAPMLQLLLQGQRYSQVNDIRESDSPVLRLTAELQGARTLLSVPLRREGKLVGMIICARFEVKPFTEREISLLESFAAQAVVAMENARLLQELRARTNDLSESLQQQTATADVLKVISRSAFDLQTVLETLIGSAVELSGAWRGTIFLRDGELFRYRAMSSTQVSPDWVDYLKRNPQKAGRHSAVGRTIATGHTVCLPDLLADPEITIPGAALGGIRAMLAVPLLREGTVEGVFGLSRQTPGPFTDRQIELVQTFADQALIAIENVRLFDEVQARTRDVEEALRYQTGSANILNVIASSPTDVQPVLKAIVESACELCEAYDAVLRLRIGDDMVFGAHHGPIPVLRNVWPLSPNWTGGRAVIEQRPVHIADYLSDEGAEFPEGRVTARQEGHRSILSVPLLREGEGIGVLTLRRKEPNPFQNKQIALLQTFANQAVIALGNVRLFEEVQAKTHDLEEALRYQTGSANILNVIASSPTDVQPVLKAIVESACELCDAHDAVVLLKDGDDLCFSAHHGPIPVNTARWPISRGWASGRAVIDRATVHVHDIYAEEDYAAGRELSRRAGSSAVRSILAAPLLREGESIGAILLRRQEVRPFNNKQIAMLQTFADQAVIAIGNVHLFEEVQARTHDLQESLQQQTATADVLKVISRSTFDLQTVLDTLLTSAARLCQADHSFIFLRDGEAFRFAAGSGGVPEWIDYLRQQSIQPGRGTVAARAVLEGHTVHIPDVLADSEYTFLEAQKRGQFRTALGVPLLREGVAIGVMVLTRPEVRPFDAGHIALVTTFADQAVIAIENIRLFESVEARTRDLQESLRQQTATADVLKVISRSAFDLQVVLDTLVESAARLCEADHGIIVRPRDGEYRVAASWGLATPEQRVYLEGRRFAPGNTTVTGRALLESRIIHVKDILADTSYFLDGDPDPARTRLGVPCCARVRQSACSS